MGFLGLGEPSLGTLIIFLGAWINRDFTTPIQRYNRCNDSTDVEDTTAVNSRMANLEPSIPNQQGRWRQREISFLGFRRVIDTPNTGAFQTRLLSKVLLRFPFIVEIIYWALIYGVYQMGRAMLAERLSGSTVEMARHHALQVIRLEEKLHMFWEPAIQRFFLQYPGVMYWINRIYSFVHLPATITFLVGLYWFAITRNRAHADWSDPISGSYLYESKRRALAVGKEILVPEQLNNMMNRFATFLLSAYFQLGRLTSVSNTRRWTNQLGMLSQVVAPTLEKRLTTSSGNAIPPLRLLALAWTYGHAATDSSSRPILPPLFAAAIL
ncbi:hypothetical protein H2202_008999 [Exophiala xenobiotica]|nr:hypothetical protein H2202_008999 [Exophiala xenobiotica]